MNLKLIHFEHALPPMAEMGLEQLLPKLFKAFLSGLSSIQRESLGEIAAALAANDTAAAGEAMVVVLQGLATQALVTLNEDDLGKIFSALAQSSNARAVRKLVAILSASGDDLLGWEDDPEKEKLALRVASQVGFEEIKQKLTDFFPQSGLSLKPSQDSSVPVKEESAPADPATSGSSEPFSPLS